MPRAESVDAAATRRRAVSVQCKNWYSRDSVLRRMIKQANSLGLTVRFEPIGVA
ncbi:hypothetical protein I6A60_30850 [Frankia sp. AgB1.9]|uniref:hypothetical protein n=1 Tax=unclassified Frankia TaxID=2632575 RepID=UPI0019312FF3|nr:MULTISPECIES: hypothetical protein [unclassified Frankia]MBL7490815.1 hypothetical protein [Frankia sp. AgW1.1]MBL7552228.1 hypothetical protein [Frankia sp. AgB1.9]MBL7622013.1 hypothetical protein [Frankia sp. AgB1.8]